MGRDGFDERKLVLNVSDEFLIRRQDHAVLLLPKGQIHAIPKATPCERRNIGRTVNEILISKETGGSSKNSVQKDTRFPDPTYFLPLGFRQGTRYFTEKTGRSDQFVDL
jgi:hypothetical protein